MKILIAAILTLFSFSALGQHWIEHRFDSVLTLLVPEKFDVKDTAGQRMLKAGIKNGLVIVTMLPHVGELAMNIHTDSELRDAYRQLQELIVNSQHGALVKDEVVSQRGLTVCRFSFRAVEDGEMQIRHLMLILVNEKTYFINFWELEGLSHTVSEDRERFFASVRFRDGVGSADQMSRTTK